MLAGLFSVTLFYKEPDMLAKILALIQMLGDKAPALIQYLLDHKDQIVAVITLLTTLFGHKLAAHHGPVTAEHFLEHGKTHGIATGDLQELLAAIPAEEC